MPRRPICSCGKFIYIFCRFHAFSCLLVRDNLVLRHSTPPPLSIKRDYALSGGPQRRALYKTKRGVKLIYLLFSQIGIEPTSIAFTVIQRHHADLFIQIELSPPSYILHLALRTVLYLQTARLTTLLARIALLCKRKDVCAHTLYRSIKEHSLTCNFIYNMLS